MPLSIQHQADSAGDKAVSLIADNSGSNVAAAFKGVNKATQNGDTVADLVVSLDGELVGIGSTGGAYADGATFTRASSKLLAGLGGIYESTVSTLTAGKVALARLTSRGAVVTAADIMTTVLYNDGGTSGASDGAMRSTSPVSFDTAATMEQARQRSIFIENTLDQAVTLILWNVQTGGYASVINFSIPAGARRVITAKSVDGGASASTLQASALDTLWGSDSYWQATPAGTPTTGKFLMICVHML